MQTLVQSSMLVWSICADVNMDHTLQYEPKHIRGGGLSPLPNKLVRMWSDLSLSQFKGIAIASYGLHSGMQQSTTDV